MTAGDARGGTDRRDLVASVAQATGATHALGLVLNSRRLRGDMVRAVSYHETPEIDRENFRTHLQYYVRHLTPLREVDLASFLGGSLKLTRPGLLVTFDDGFKSNYEVAADVLDQFGVKGFFFVPAGFIQQSGSPAAARDYVANKLYPGSAPAGWGDEDFQPMSWDDLRDLVRRGHTVGCHGLNHVALGPDPDEETLRREIIEAKSVLERELGTPVTSFCWPFGTLASYSQSAFELIRQHYTYAFSTFAQPLLPGANPHAIDRSRLEPRMGLARVRWSVQGPAELYLRSRRKRFETLVDLNGG